MLKAEWKYLLKHKFLLFVLFVVSFIPTIYAATFLSSMWDPYGELNKLPVAIVNNDRSASMNGKTMHLGDALTKSLVKKQSLKFKEVSAAQARAGLKDGKYYAVYTIPTTFSKNATSLLTDSPKTMKLSLRTSSGHNMTAGKMATSAATAMQVKLNGQIASTYAKVLVNSVTKLEDGLTQAASGSKTIADGEKTVKAGTTKLNTNLKKLASGTLELQTGSKTLATGIGSYVGAVSQVKSGADELATGLNTVNTKLPTLTAGMTKLAAGSSTLATGLNQDAAGLTKLQSGAATLASGLKTYQTSNATLAAKSTTFATQLKAFSTQLQAALGATSGAQTQLTQLAQLLQATMTALNKISASQAATSAAVTASIKAEAATLNLTADQTDALVKSATGTMTASATQQSAALAPLLTQLQTALTSLSNMSSSTDTTKVTTALTALTGAADQLATANGQLATAGTQLVTGSQTLASGITTATTGTQKLATGAATLNSGINSAMPQIATLTSGMTKLADGAKTLDDGVTTLDGKSNDLQSGANTLSTGITTANSGASQLATGAATLDSGTTKLAAGSAKLSAKLGNATANLTKVTFKSKQSKAFASPVELKASEQDSTPNNGTSMAPYMIGVSLYVGAMILNLMFDAYTPRKKPNSGLAWWFSKSFIMNTIAIAAATIVFAALTGLNHLNPVAPFRTWILMVLAAIAYMQLVTWLNLLLGKPGSFLALVLLVVQLGGSAGTYPIELSNKFFETIHPFLPMSHVVSGLRETIMIGDSAAGSMVVMAGIFIAFSLLNLVHYIRLNARMSDIDFDATSSEADA